MRRLLITTALFLALVSVGNLTAPGAQALDAVFRAPKTLALLITAPNATDALAQNTAVPTAKTPPGVAPSDAFSETTTQLLEAAFSAIVGTNGSNSHTSCQGNQCVVVAGEGLNQCDSNAECVGSHKACRGLSCVTVPEPGVNECASSAECAIYANNATPFHKACRDGGLGPQCAIIPGAGSDLCTSNSSCGYAPDGSCETPGFCSGDPGPIVPGTLPGCDDISLSCPVPDPEIQCIGSEFGAGHPWGVDVSTAGIGGSPVFAFAEGDTFIANPPVSPGCTGTGPAHGIAVRLTCNPSITLTYCHTVPSVPAGAHVTAGQQIGNIATTINPGESSTGPHLHFEIRQNNVALSPRSYVPCLRTMPHC